MQTSGGPLRDVLVDDTPYDMARDGVMRGGSYLFVRWLYDRAGGDTAKSDGTIEGHGGPAFLRAVLEAPASVATSGEHGTAPDPLSWAVGQCRNHQGG